MKTTKRESEEQRRKRTGIRQPSRERVVWARAPKSHRDCAYCGVGGDGIHVCGECRAAGIDGPVIRGTSGVRAKTSTKKKRVTVKDFWAGLILGR